MSSFRISQVLLLVSTLAIVPAFGNTTNRTAGTAHSSSKKSKRKQVSHLHGQRVIDSSRAAEIQSALIQKKYLSGAATGQWDEQTQAAMKQYQSDHGWQTKLTPDSRALISLGLGPTATTDSSVHTTAVAKTMPAAESTDQAQSAEPMPNTLASVHSLAQ